MKCLIISPLLCIVCLLAGAQRISSDQTRKDLAILKKGIETYNPSLKVYNPDFNSKSEQLINQITTDSISFIRYFQYVSRLCALSNEGHFLLGNWNDTLHVGITKNRYKYLPISIKVLSNRIFVWEDYSNEQELKKGIEILSINGMGSTEILSQLRDALPVDGQIKTYADKQISDGFSWMYYFYVDQQNLLNLNVQFPNEQKKNVAIEAIPIETQRANYKEFVASKNDPDKEKADSFYELRHENGVSYLTLPSFDFRRVNKYDVKPKSMYGSIFEELSDEKTKHLVVDLRGNTGGRHEFAHGLVPYVLKENQDARFLKKSVSWEGKEKTYKTPKPAKKVFNGEIYVLVDGLTFSSGGSLARYLKEFGNATIIGEETGARYEGFSAGSKEYITLPNSQLRIGIPRYWTFFPKSEKQKTANRGLLPDHEIQYTIEDLMSGTDLHMQKCRSLIDK